MTKAQRMMEYGFKIQSGGPLATPEAIAALARMGESMGFGIIGVSDHIVIPRQIRSLYPYSKSREFDNTPGEFLDQLVLVSFLAGQTSSARLLTSVMVLPHRSPVLAAKMLATIDVLSQGRLIVGCGVGWDEGRIRDDWRAAIQGARGGRRRVRPRLQGTMDQR